MSYKKVMVRYISFAFALNLFVGMEALAPKEESVYQQELKALQQRSFYKTMLDRRSAGGPKGILANIENARELTLFSRVLTGTGCFHKGFNELRGYFDRARFIA